MAEGYINHTDGISQGEVTWNTTNVTGDSVRKIWRKNGNIVIAGLEFTPISGKIAIDNEICSGLPIPKYPDSAIFESNGRQMQVTATGILRWYYPTNTSTLTRIDITLVYI